MKIFNLVFILFFSACSLKVESPALAYYELYFTSDKCGAENKNLHNLYIDFVLADALTNSRELAIIEKQQALTYVENFRFVSNPSDMLYKALNQAFFVTCKISPSLMINYSSDILKVRILELIIKEKQASFSLAYELVGEKAKSGIITFKNPVKEQSEEGYFQALNLSFNEALQELVKKIKG